MFFALGLGGDVRSTTHWGGGDGASDGDPCAIVYADLVERGNKEAE